MDQEIQSSTPISAVPPPVAPTSPQIKYAGFWIRGIAVFIDGVVLIIINVVIGLLAAISASSISSYGWILSILISWAYFIVMTNNSQATIGKKAVGIIVVSTDLTPPTIGQIILRETVGRIVSGIILGIGYLMAAFTPRKRALHDMMASTLVIYKDPNKKQSTGVRIIIVILCALLGLALLGIVSAILLASLNSARVKYNSSSMLQNSGLQTANQTSDIKPILSNLRAEGEILYTDNNNSYQKLCMGGILNVDASPYIRSAAADILNNLKVSSQQNALVKCYSAKDWYAVSAKTPDFKFWCVDSTGFSNYGIADSRAMHCISE
jgi:uncharacterized RDD family membrane protein YckC